MDNLSMETVARDLELARRRTLTLTDLDEPDLIAQHNPLMSPLVWDLAHIGQQEDLWLLRQGDTRRPGLLPYEVEQLYDAFRHPRAVRPQLPLLPPVEARAFCHEVRGRVWDLLARAENSPRGSLFPYEMVVQHEQQHDETMLATLQLRQGEPVLPAAHPLPPGRHVPHDAVLIPAGPFQMGVDGTHEPWSLDNERPAHTVDLPAFRIDRFPVTNAEWSAFIAASGYEQPRWWSPAGWAHRIEAGLERPLFWIPGGGRRRFGLLEDVPPEEPVQHISFYEAQAYAAWAGARLPTEQEWEKACCWDPVTGQRRRWPWGDSEPSNALTNLGGDALRPAPVGAYPAGASAYGVEHTIGDVWEWTSSPFRPWQGFAPMLYSDYSAPFFGDDFRVLRGGSWAVAPASIRPSFRNWDLPVRRQIFAGVRLAWDA